MGDVMKTIIFDLDGTLANVEHRRRLKEDGSFDWKYFNDSVNIKLDKPNMAIVDLYRNLCGKYSLVIVSGRSDACYYKTREWLENNGVVNYNKLILRTRGDYRPDHILKEEILNVLIAEGHEISFVIDDRQSVVDMWRRNGITCLQCAKGDF